MTERIKVVYQYSSYASIHGNGPEKYDISFYNSRMGMRVTQESHSTAFGGSSSQATLETITRSEITELEKKKPFRKQIIFSKSTNEGRVNIKTIKFEKFEDLIARLGSINGIKTGYMPRSIILNQLNFEYVKDINTIAGAYFSLDDSRLYLSKLYGQLKKNEKT